MTSSRRALAVALALGVVLPGAVTMEVREVRAQPSPADFATARELYKKGKELRAKGEVREALEKFKAAHALGQTPVTGIELAKTHAQLGQLVEAREVCLAIKRIPIASDETGKSTEARDEAEKLGEQLKPRIPTVLVRVNNVPRGAALVVSIDGARIPPAAIGERRMVDPGKHELSARIEGTTNEAKEAIDLTESESREVTLTLPGSSDLPPLPTATATATVAPPPTVTAPPPQPPPPRDDGSGRLIGVGFGIGAVSAVISTLTYLYHLDLKSDLDNDPFCRNKVCLPNKENDIEQMKTAGTIATVTFVIAVGGGLLGVIGLATRKSTPDPAAAQVRPWIGVGGAGLSGRF